MKSILTIPIRLLLFTSLALAATLPVLADSGTFEGRTKHKTSGTASIVKTDSGYALKLSANFKFDGAPDPKLGFGKDGFKKGTLVSKLKKNKGAQTYPLPKTFDPAKYNEVWLWCEKFNVPLGVAKLK